MIERVHRDRYVAELFIAAATCDRCGNELQRVTGFSDPDFPFRGIAVRGRLYAKSGNADETRTISAELCESCVELLIGWIGAKEDVLDRERIWLT